MLGHVGSDYTHEYSPLYIAAAWSILRPPAADRSGAAGAGDALVTSHGGAPLRGAHYVVVFAPGAVIAASSGADAVDVDLLTVRATTAEPLSVDANDFTC